MHMDTYAYINTYIHTRIQIYSQKKSSLLSLTAKTLLILMKVEDLR